MKKNSKEKKKSSENSTDIDHYEHLRIHEEIVRKQFEYEKERAILQAFNIIETAPNFEVIADLLVQYVNTNKMIEIYEMYLEQNIYVNSPLYKALQEK